MADATQSELEAYLALRDALVESKHQLAQFLLANPGDPETQRLQNLVLQHGRAITSLTAHSIGVLGSNTAAAMAELKRVSKDAKTFIAQIARIKKGLKVITSLLTLAASVVMGDVSGILGAIGTVKDAVAAGPADS